MAIRMRRGNEADFDPSKMLPGEWAVSTDTKYVRMCFSPGIVLRMATYEAFESDMAEIRNILSQCQNIQTAVELIQKNVTASELVIENYVKEAKQYRDEAEQFRNEAFATTPEGYEYLVKNVSDNTVKIDTIIEKAELNIKNNAKGNNIHLTDSAESNVVSLEMYGKTEQNAYTGKNLLDCSELTETTTNGVTFTPIYDGNGSLKYINANGTASADTFFRIGGFTFDTKTYILNGCPSGGSYSTYMLYLNTSYDTGNGINVTFTEAVTYSVLIKVGSGTTLANKKFYPMISLEGGKYEPYVGGKPSPSPSYPQEIKSVVLNTIKTHGKNLLDCTGLTKQTTNGITFTPVYDDNGNLLYVNVNGTASERADYVMNDFTLSTGKYILNGCPSGGVASSYRLRSAFYNDDTFVGSVTSVDDYGSGFTFNYDANTSTYNKMKSSIIIMKGTVCNNLKFYPMIRLADVSDDTYQPYQSTEITLSEPIELNGFNGVYDVVESGKITKKIKRRRLLSSDGWGAHSNGWIYTMSIADFKYGDIQSGTTYYTKDAFCTHLVYQNNAKIITDKVSQGITMWYDTSYGGYRVAVYLPDMTSDEWNTFIDENEVYLVYELATPTTEELQSDFTALKTFYPETYVSNDADCDMSITYTADAKNYIDNKIALLTTALYNNI